MAKLRKEIEGKYKIILEIIILKMHKGGWLSLKV